MRNMPRGLIFMVPADLAAGEYKLEVRALFGQAMRTGTFHKTLTVA